MGRFLALLFTVLALSATPAWSKHENSQPIETPDSGGFEEAGKTLSVTEQLSELEMMVLKQDFADDPMQVRVTRLVHQVLPGEEQSLDSLSIEGQIGRVWEALQASQKHKPNSGHKRQSSIATTAGAAASSSVSAADASSDANITDSSISTPSSPGGHPPFPRSSSIASAVSDPTFSTSFASAHPPFPKPEYQVPSTTGLSAFQSMSSDGRTFQSSDGNFRPPINFDQGHEDINLNRRIMAFAAKNFGKQVGNGECWTLAADALQAAGGIPAQDYVFGRPLNRDEQWWPGDIIQFTKCRFKETLPGPGNRHVIISAGAPNHTAIYGGQQNGSSMIAQQNNNGVKKVSVMYLDFSTLVSGSFNVYRPLMPPANQGMNQ